VQDGQLVKKAPSAFFGRGEGGGGGSKAHAHRPGVPGGDLSGWQRVGEPAFAIRGRPGDRRLLPAAPLVRALHSIPGALKAAGGGQQQCLRALDGLEGIPVCAGHQAAEFFDEPGNLFFTLVGRMLTLVGLTLTLVRRTLALVRRTLALVGRTLAPVGRTLTPFGEALTLVGLTLTLVGEGFAYVGRMLALAQALAWLRGGLAVAVHASRMP